MTGIGYLTYRNCISTVPTYDLDWLDRDIKFPYIQGTNMSGDFKEIILKPEDKLKLQFKLMNMQENGEKVTEVEFNTDENENVKIIMTEDDIKQEIKNIDSRIKTIENINKISDLESILDISSEFEMEDYIPYKGMYIEKSNKDIKEQIKEKIDQLKEKSTSGNRGKKSLLIAENLETEDYIETENIAKYTHKVEIPKNLNDNINLLEYQEDSLNKLQMLYLDSNINGFLLCDDMGLGKTLQLLLFIAWLKEKNSVIPSLIVAPSSLLNNWDNESLDEPGEIQKFFPKGFFSTYKIKGKITEDDLNILREKDIVFTTYETLRINNILLGKINWKVMICDEAQKIKNPMTLVTVAAKAQNADFKIICSATPIENSLEDLWTLTDYSKPGLLGSLKNFRNEYIKGYDGDDVDALKSLNDKLYSKIEPFYIRREKDILPKELPKKTIKIYKCKPTNIELDYLDKIKNTESVALSAIQKMLAVCIHVDLLNQNYEISNIEKQIDKSSKLKITKVILDDIKLKNEKVIIFTRFKKAQLILSKAIKYWYGFEPIVVNGNISNLNKRTRLISKFRKEVGFSVIILSPDVAGFGITLTEANHVIHYSRLWNPAKEDQSTDRVYRIGQDKDVTVYYPMITFGQEEVLEYESAEDYVDDNMVKKNDYLSPEEKLNILLARKKNMLLNFFLAAASNDIGVNEFFELESEEKNQKKCYLTMDYLDLMNKQEFEALVEALYSKMGYKTFLMKNSGVDIIAINDYEALFIKCTDKEKVDIDDLIYNRSIYERYINRKNLKNVIVTKRDYIDIDDKKAEIIKSDDLKFWLDEFGVLKEELDFRNKNRLSYEGFIECIDYI